ncbi:hypothetical protein DPMN_184742 [Dreissena polymorpha]|uniref:Uncharacterized protein n=1 Tax=Dreissena polymorpha TaxID=45954 RepID=A0A9D4DJP0_DREPO|nr:hypothetical protein DPMN_184742 [Dreissena polymorpha]
MEGARARVQMIRSGFYRCSHQSEQNPHGNRTRHHLCCLGKYLRMMGKTILI